MVREGGSEPALHLGASVSETCDMADDRARADPLEFTMRWPVRGYELDSRGHVNNAVYLSWAEELATAHAEAAGYRPDTVAQRGGGRGARRNEIRYHRPANYGGPGGVCPPAPG